MEQRGQLGTHSFNSLETISLSVLNKTYHQISLDSYQQIHQVVAKFRLLLSHQVPAVVFDHVYCLDDELSFFVFLTAFKCKLLKEFNIKICTNALRHVEMIKAIKKEPSLKMSVNEPF